MMLGCHALVARAAGGSGSFTKLGGGPCRDDDWERPSYCDNEWETPWASSLQACEDVCQQYKGCVGIYFGSQWGCRVFFDTYAEARVMEVSEDLSYGCERDGGHGPLTQTDESTPNIQCYAYTAPASAFFDQWPLICAGLGITCIVALFFRCCCKPSGEVRDAGAHLRQPDVPFLPASGQASLDANYRHAASIQLSANGPSASFSEGLQPSSEQAVRGEVQSSAQGLAVRPSSSQVDVRNSAADAVPEGGTCCICITNTASHVCVPCGHQALCASCLASLSASNALQECPICRRRVEQCIQVFKG